MANYIVKRSRDSYNRNRKDKDMEECHYCEGAEEEEIDHEIIECITGALDAKDTYTAGHSQRVSEMVLKNT